MNEYFLITTCLPNVFSFIQQLELAKNVEEFVFWSGDNDGLHSAKQELIEQMTKFDIVIRAKGFFDLNRQFLASVSVFVTKLRTFILFSILLKLMYQFFSWFPLAARTSLYFYSSIWLLK